MAYFRPSIDAGGVHIPVYDDILEYLTDQYKIIFGDDVYLGMDSKDYQMLAIFAKALDDFAALAVDAYNSRSPLYATGDSLDVLCTLVGTTRRSSEQAVSEVELTGVANTGVPAGTQFADVNGDLWSLDAEVEINGNGVATGTVTKEKPGRVSLTSNYIVSAYDTIVGLEGVRNTTVGYAGKDTESDDELRIRMRDTLLARAMTVDIAIEAAIEKIEDVTGVKVYVNDSDSTDANGIPAHSICPVVQGGNDNEIAQAFFDSKAPGIGTYGDVTETVVDAYGRSESVSFKRPTRKQFAPVIYGTVYDTQVDLNALKTQIKNAIFEWGNKLGVGESLIVSRIYPVIYSAIQVSGVAITGITVSGTWGSESSMVEAEWDWMFYINSLDDINVSNIVAG